MKKGYFFIEILVGLSILGLIATTTLPILNMSIDNFNRIKDKSEMNYIAEYVIEKFKTKDDYILELMSLLEGLPMVDYKDDSIDNLKYICSIIKTSNSDKLLEFKVRVNKIGQEKDYVEYKASIPK